MRTSLNRAVRLAAVVLHKFLISCGYSAVLFGRVSEPGCGMDANHLHGRFPSIGSLSEHSVNRRDKFLRYEVHAKTRMAQRGISREQVEAVVFNPDTSRPAERPGAKRLEKKLSTSVRLAVIVEEDEAMIRIVTAFKM